LACILKETSEKSSVRQAAGLQLKNVFVAKDPKFRDQSIQRWLAMPGQIRDEIKTAVRKLLDGIL